MLLILHYLSPKLRSFLEDIQLLYNLVSCFDQNDCQNSGLPCYPQIETNEVIVQIMMINVGASSNPGTTRTRFIIAFLAIAT
jgi:hypothetical protein